MRIHYLCRSQFASRAANAVHVHSMAVALRDLGHQVHVFAVDRPSPALHGIHWNAAGTDRGLAVSFRTRRADRAGPQADLYYARHAPSALVAARRGVPLIYEIHALQTNLTGIVIESALIRTGRVAGIVAVSDVLRTDLLARYRHLDPKRVVVAHDAAWPVTNHPDPLWRRPRDTLQVGYVGSFFPGKGAQFTVQLARACPEYDFHIVGGSTREQLALRCANPPDNVTIHGHIAHSDLSRVYAALDVGLVPNAAHVLDHGGQDIGRWTSPLKLFEYMSHGLTVVASDLPTIREVVTHAEHAMLAPPGQVAVWAELLRRCATDQNSSRRIAERGRLLVRSRHSWTRRASDVLAAFPAEGPLRRPEHDH